MIREAAMSIFRAGVHAVLPPVFMDDFFDRKGKEIRIGQQWIDTASIGRLVVLAMGKAAALMALEWQKKAGDLVQEALVITKEAHALPALSWPQLEAGHPVPDAQSLAAGLAVKKLVSSLREEDLLLVLLSGGASALVADAPEGCSLEDMQSFYQLLLASGASIQEMNAVRKHFSGIKGGQLARLANNARIEVAVVSDVPGDDFSVIASGPFFPDSSTIGEVDQTIYRYQLQDQLPPAIAAQLAKIRADARYETPKPGDPVFDRITHHLLATNQTALEAAAQAALQAGYDPVIFQSRLEGEAREQASVLLAHCLQEMEEVVGREQNAARCFIAGGETTVTLTGNGKGGRNQEFVLSLVAACVESPDLYSRLNFFDFAILSGGTDGTDGPTDAAGALVDHELLHRINSVGPDPRPAFINQDAYTYFGSVGGLIKTGPTQTNVMDMVLILLKSKAAIRPTGS
ncbi:DUF4147 domain-containing protein [Flavihumibacter sp. CACIAM 22H1]|uniref:glycerate kinase type-2 family protein n=1 Tax=Flavihumibacter sp. CACIAM 22H1 TaxID=1812911 RepID=UPI0007A93200|nr:DUF4147 domain-containing protein [Flavihumibacter sp. CACIAM 22H1]KYP16528.1 MAG: hypothetical protein A1D16_13745 [Flavihumibacter sp. CACIAM 22H1]